MLKGFLEKLDRVGGFSYATQYALSQKERESLGMFKNAPESYQELSMVGLAVNDCYGVEMMKIKQIFLMPNEKKVWLGIANMFKSHTFAVRQVPYGTSPLSEPAFSVVYLRWARYILGDGGVEIFSEDNSKIISLDGKDGIDGANLQFEAKDRSYLLKGFLEGDYSDMNFAIFDEQGDCLAYFKSSALSFDCEKRKNTVFVNKSLPGDIKSSFVLMVLLRYIDWQLTSAS